MLILSRKLGESIVIGDDVVIRIVELRRSRIRIGIEAPDHVRIRRGELLEPECFQLERRIGRDEELTIGDEFEMEATAATSC